MHKKILTFLVLACCHLFASAQSSNNLTIQHNDSLFLPGKMVVITTNIGTMKARFYKNTPNHVKTFINKAVQGDFNGTLFTRVIPEFMIQGGAYDSKKAAPGARCGYGDNTAQIMPEIDKGHFFKKGVLAAPRQNDDINPLKKSDMSQFFIVHGKIYREGELDTLEMITNKDIKEKAMAKFYVPQRAQLRMQKVSNKREYIKKVKKILAQVDSMILATPGHLVFSKEQRMTYTTIGGCHHLDGQYSAFGEVIEGLELIDEIANQPKDKFDRPKKDIRIQSISIENN